MAKLKLKEDVSSVSWNGAEYKPNKKGVVEVPDGAIPHLQHCIIQGPAPTDDEKPDQTGNPS